MSKNWSTIVSYSAEDVRKRATGVLKSRVSKRVMDPDRQSDRSDFDLNPELMPIEQPSSGLRRAAVLVPIIKRAPEATILFTQRSEDMPTHPGQISFPGGKIEPHDDTPLDTAFRETEEEIGLQRKNIEFLGFLDNYRTGTGFHIAPALGLVPPDFDLKIEDKEVADVFEVPLSFLMTVENHQKHERELNGRNRRFYAMPYQDRFIWGATAGILRNMFERLYI